MLNFQNVSGKSKPYQIRQLIKIIGNYSAYKTISQAVTPHYYNIFTFMKSISEDISYECFIKSYKMYFCHQ